MLFFSSFKLPNLFFLEVVGPRRAALGRPARLSREDKRPPVSAPKRGAETENNTSLSRPPILEQRAHFHQRLLCEELLRHSSTLLQHDPHNTDAMLQQYAALPGSLTNLTSLEPVLPPFLR